MFSRLCGGIRFDEEYFHDGSRKNQFAADFSELWGTPGDKGVQLKRLSASLCASTPLRQPQRVLFE